VELGTRRSSGLFALLALGLAGCPRSGAPGDAGTSTSADGAAAPVPVEAGSEVGVRPSTAHGKRPVSACRAVSVSGTVAWGDGSENVADNANLPDQMFLTLGDKATFTARDPRSLRETRFTGPGIVRPCVEAQERSDLVTGTFTSTPGSGEAAGHEEWVVTGLAVVRYSSAAIEIRSTGLKALVDIRPRGGEAFLWVSPYAKMTPATHDGGAGGWIPLSTTSAESYRIYPRGEGDPGAPASRSGHVDPDDSFVRDCLTRAATAAADADRLRHAGPGFGAAAGAHVEALKSARAACSIASLQSAYSFASAGDGGVADGAHRANLAIEAAMLHAKLGDGH
jgi:hypothetical protein